MSNGLKYDGLRCDAWNHKEDIIKLYQKDLLNPKQISKIYHCSVCPIKSILKKEGVIQGISQRRILLIKHGKIKIFNKIDPNRIIKLYKKNTVAEISRMMNCSKFTIHKIINKNKVKLKGHRFYTPTEETKNRLRLKFCLDKNPAWTGGKSFEPYGIEFNEIFKEEIRKRDDFKCQECHIKQQNAYSKKGKKYKLHVHHIDYNKENNSILNLICLCRDCHLKTNLNRNHWENYFKMKIFIKELFNPSNILTFENNKLIGVINGKV